MVNLRSIVAGCGRIIAAKGVRITFLANLLIGFAIALLVYFVEQTGLIEHLLNRVLFLLLGMLGMVIEYQKYHVITVAGLALDAVTVSVAVALWTVLRSPSARILANLVLFAVLIPFTMTMLDQYGILFRGAPIVFCIIIAIAMDAAAEQIRKLLHRRIAEEKQGAEFCVISHLTHNVKPALQIARSPLLTIQRFLETRGLLSTEVGYRLDGSPETVGEILNNTMASLSQINDIIDSTRQLVTREIKREDFQDIELKTLLEQEVLPLHAGKFRIVIDGGTIWLPLHRESIVEAFNNLLRNAEVHGFHELTPDSEVRFQLRQTPKWVVIDYTNNGRPLPVNLSVSDFLTFGRKSVDSPGQGLGGAWVGKTVEAHGGNFAIIHDTHPVHFRIRLPKRGN